MVQSMMCLCSSVDEDMWYILTLFCWQLLKGTHRCGRIEHNLLHGQTVADSERIQQLSKCFEHLYADLQPGEERHNVTVILDM